MKTLILLALAVAPWASSIAAEPAPKPAPPPVAEKSADKTVPVPAVKAPAFLGVALDEVDDALAYHLKLANDLGVLVTAVTPGSPAEGMGIKPYDVIVAADGQPVYTPRALTGLVRAKAVGDAITVQVRRGADTVEVKGALAARPVEADAPSEGPGGPGPGWFHRFGPGPGGPGPDAGNRRGTMKHPDGSSSEWSIEESPEPPAPRAVP